MNEPKSVLVARVLACVRDALISVVLVAGLVVSIGMVQAAREASRPPVSPADIDGCAKTGAPIYCDNLPD